MDALILSIETSTVPFSVAISRNEVVISTIENDQRTALASSITLMIEQCTAQAGISLSQLSAIAISPGPGSYTGLRIGMSAAKGLCFALKVPLIFISGLKALAAQTITGTQGNIGPSTLLCAALDARRDEVYLEVYDHMLKQILPSTAVIIPQEISLLIDGEYDGIICLGDGGAKLENRLGSFDYKVLPIYSSAAWMAPLAYQQWKIRKFESVETSEPFYLKPPNITIPKDRTL